MARPKLRGDRVPGLFIRTQESGAKSYVAVARDRNGKQVWKKLGSTETMDLEEARDAARDAVKAIKAGKRVGGPESFEKVVEAFMVHHVAQKEILSERDIRRRLDKHVMPAWAARDFTGIRRGDVTSLLDGIVESAGPVAADKILSILSKLMRWYATRNDDYNTPIVPGMRRSDPKQRARTRILSDEELRLVWKAAEANGTFGAFIRIALLTGQRKTKIQTMKWEDVKSGVWTITAAAREKGTAGELVLPKEALAIIDSLPRLAATPFVFGVGRSYIAGFGPRKSAFDAKAPIAPWTIHDLRRTARSLMAQAGVRSDIAERVMGHAIAGVEGIYDRHKYRDEKATALMLLAQRITDIVIPPPDNVLPIRQSGT